MRPTILRAVYLSNMCAVAGKTECFTTLSFPYFVFNFTTSLFVSLASRAPVGVYGLGVPLCSRVTHDVGVHATFASIEEQGSGCHDPEDFSGPAH